MIKAALREFIRAHGTQGEMSDATGLKQTTISSHVNGRRPVTGWHLLSYLKAASAEERPRLVAAWLRTYLPADLANEILSGDARIAEEGARYAPNLPDSTKSALHYMHGLALDDADVAQALETFARHMGWKNYSEGDTLR